MGAIMIIEKAVLLFAALTLLSSCDEFPGSTTAKAHDAVRALMFDADAAKFRNDEAGSSPNSICGEVNGKNRMGAYVGFTKYVYGADVAVVSQGDPDFAEYYRETQPYNEFTFKEAFNKVQNACLFASEWMIFCAADQKPQEADFDRQCKLWTQGGDGEKKLKSELGIE
jgi:hypothetical protein